jgi:pyridoxamine 5'-phosphate oxidase family protein
MTFSDAEQEYLAGQRHGRLATVAANGFPQVKPVGFTYNPRLGTIDIVGYNMASSAKYKNVQANPKVAFTVDDAPGEAHAAMAARSVVGKTLLIVE